MEGEDGGASAGLEHRGELFQKGVQDLILAVHVDAQGLEGPLAGLLHALLPLLGGQEGEGLLDDPGQGLGGLDLAALFQGGEDGLGDGLGVGLVGVFHQHGGQLLPVQLPQPLGGGDPGGGIQAQVQGAVVLEGKAPGRVVDLHGGDAQVRQHEVELHPGGHLVQVGEVHAPDGQDVRAVAQGL